MTSTLAGTTVPAAVTSIGRNFGSRSAARTTALYPETVAWDESASIDCARVMRGIDSIANAVTPREPRRSMPSWSVSGWRKPISTWPSRSLPTSSSLGLRTLATRSAAHGSPIAAPASVNASSVNEAAVPAPCSTTTSIPSSFATRSGTSATLRSP